MFITLSLCIAAIASVPMLFAKRWGEAVATAIASFLLALLISYLALPNLEMPLWGGVGVMAVIFTVIAAVIAVAMTENLSPVVPAALAVVAILIPSCTGCSAFRAEDYARLIGKFEVREWTQDVQPKDSKHVRLVSLENALFLANKQLGDARQYGALGSQFQIDSAATTLQVINGELWYVAPLDFREYAVWTSTNGAPGYIKVSAEDPYRIPTVVTSHSFKYTPGAYFGDNLQRYLWRHGYTSIIETNFELDDDARPWYISTVYSPTISYWGPKVKGVVLVDPSTGEIDSYTMGEIPSWIDRALPGEFVSLYLKYAGKYHSGWWNSFWDQKDITEPETPSIIYGSDHEPYWVTSITSPNKNDESMVSLFYIDSRTGKTIQYHASGSTEEGILIAVNNKVGYMKKHGSGPVLYNIYGTMAYIVPLLGENHTFLGVAICNVDNLIIAVGSDAYSAYREYQKLMASVGQQIAPEASHGVMEILAQVQRIATELREGGNQYIIYAQDHPKLFTGGSELSLKLPVTQAGDKVKLSFVDSGEDIVPLVAFDNLSLKLSGTALQAGVRTQTQERAAASREERDVKSARGEVKEMSDKELLELKRLRDQQKKK